MIGELEKKWNDAIEELRKKKEQTVTIFAEKEEKRKEKKLDVVIEISNKVADTILHKSKTGTCKLTLPVKNEPRYAINGTEYPSQCGVDSEKVTQLLRAAGYNVIPETNKNEENAVAYRVSVPKE